MAGGDLSYLVKDVTDARSPVGKFKLSNLMTYDSRASYRHKMLWEFHLQWAHADYEWTSLAGARTIHSVMAERSPTGKALSLRHISEGNRDLCSWGYLTELEKGRGRRASRYAVSWNLLDLAAADRFPPSVSNRGDTNDCVSHAGNASVSQMGNATTLSVPPEGNEDPTTPTRLPTGVGVERDAAPPALPGSGLAAAPAGSGEDFNKLYLNYGVRFDRMRARAEFDLLAPDDGVTKQMIEAATRWRMEYDRQLRGPQHRKRLATWLKEERWLEDGPSFPPQVRAAVTPLTTPRRAPTIEAEAFAEAVPELYTIVRSDAGDDEGRAWASIVLRAPDGRETTRSFAVEGAEKRDFASLCLAAGIDKPIDDTEELHGRSVLVVGERFLPPPANDNTDANIGAAAPAN